MTTINHLLGHAFVKKTGDRIDVFEGPHTLADFFSVIAEGSDVSRMLKDRFADLVNVKDYGAKGDGITDDTEALEAAAVAAEGKTLFFPAGTYLTSTGLLVRDRTTVIGAGMYQTTIKLSDTAPSCAAALTNVLNRQTQAAYVESLGSYTAALRDANTGNKSIYVSGLTVDGNGNRTGNPQIGHGGSAVQFAFVDGLVMRNVRAINGYIHCVDICSAMFADAYDPDAEGITQDDEGNYVGNWYVGASKNVYLENVIAEDSVVDDGITTHYSHDIWLVNCFAKRSTANDQIQNLPDRQCGIEVDDGSYRVFVIGGASERYYAGLAIKGHSLAYPAHDVTVSDFFASNCVINYRILTNAEGTFNKANGYPARNIRLLGCTSATPAFLSSGHFTDYDKLGYYLSVSNYKNVSIVDFNFVCNSSVVTNDVVVLLNEECEDVEIVRPRFTNINQIESKNRSLIYCFNNVGKGIRIKDVCALDCEGGKYVVEFRNPNQGVVISGVTARRSTTVDGSAVAFVKNASIDSNGTVLEDFDFSGYAQFFKDDSSVTPKLVQATPRDARVQNLPATTWHRAVQTETPETLVPRVISSQGVFTEKAAFFSNECAYSGFYEKLREQSSRCIGLIGVRNESKGSAGSWCISFGTHDGTALMPRWEIRNQGHLVPYADNAYSLGNASSRLTQVFAATAAINTSDQRVKTSVASASDTLLDAIGNVPIHTFQFTDAVKKKGADVARFHTGVIAQEVQEAFSQKGLDASKYGLFCHDSWKDEYETVEVVDQPEVLDENGDVVTPPVTHTEERLVQKAGDRYGIRYEELLILECARLRRELQRVNAALIAHGITLGDE